MSIYKVSHNPDSFILRLIGIHCHFMSPGYSPPLDCKFLKGRVMSSLSPDPQVQVRNPKVMGITNDKGIIK